MGLYVTYQIIKQYGGDIEIHSQEGVGTTVTMTFPVLSTKESQNDEFISAQWV